jgi:hypothetical protein
MPMSDGFKAFMESKAGCALQHNVQRLADALEKLANPMTYTITDGQFTPISVPKKDDVMAAFDDFVARLKAEHEQPLNAHLTEVLAQRAKLRQVYESAQDWQFTRIEPFFSQSYRFRQAENGFYHFVATLLGHGPDQIFAINLMGDCGSDTYRCGDTCSVRDFAHWIGYSDPQYLLSKGNVHQSFHKDRAREQMQVFFKEHECVWGDDPETPMPELLAHWQAYGQLVDQELRVSCSNVSDLYHIVEEAADALDADEETCEKFKEYMTTDFHDHDWGLDYDAQDYARIEQARWFGIWLLTHLSALKKEAGDGPAHQG